MKKIIRGLLAAAAVLSPSVGRATVANKTILADRGAVSNNVLLSTSACGKKDHNKDALGADISVAGFYRQSHNKTKLAQYFGGGTDLLPAGNIEVATTALATTALNSTDMEVATTNALGMYGVVGLSPRRIEAGAHIQWNQCLNKFVKGLWMSVAAPVVYVRTEMRPDFSDKHTDADGQDLGDFFTGNAIPRAVYGATVVQDALANQKLTTTYNSATGVADVKAAVGYKFVQEKDYSFGASVHALIPTGNKQAGVVAFEPTYGNRSFFFGAGLDGQFNLFRTEDRAQELNMHACAKYSYGFGAEQVRTLGLTHATNGAYAQGQYRVVGKTGTAHAMPLANVSTLAVTVEPRSRLEAVAGFCYRFNRFTVDAAYNLFYAQAEKVKAKGLLDETLYQRVNTTVATTAIDNGDTFGAAGTVRDGLILNTATTANGLDLAAATTPAQVIHKVGGGVGYSFATKMPIRIGAGADVDFSSNNHSLNAWTAWAKIGFSF